MKVLFKRLTQEQLDMLLDSHEISLSNGPGGISLGLFGSDLSNLDFSNRNLSSAHLSGSNLSGCNFTNSNLTRANLSSCNIQGANFADADISEASLAFTECQGALFINTKTEGTFFREANGVVLTKSTTGPEAVERKQKKVSRSLKGKQQKKAKSLLTKVMKAARIYL